MLKDITIMDLNMLGMYITDYAAAFSIREITIKLNINYSHAFKRIKLLIKQEILTEKKRGQANEITFNISNMDAIQMLCFVEESSQLQNSALRIIAKEAMQIDPFACIGVFGSRVSGKAVKTSDWDVFIIAQKSRISRMNKIMKKFPHVRNIQMQIFSIDEFEESLLSAEETVVKHIIRNKRIVYNPHPFYSLIQKWERIKYAPSQTN
ncbi:MAG: nucleotidyltransferase domain-containing protein [Nanoarchaeota archaeon]|nr:nucleotidyltransferase domain-containing protein [Nanoarchaeota archaeon]